MDRSKAKQFLSCQIIRPQPPIHGFRRRAPREGGNYGDAGTMAALRQLYSGYACIDEAPAVHAVGRLSSCYDRGCPPWRRGVQRRTTCVAQDGSVRRRGGCGRLREPSVASQPWEPREQAGVAGIGLRICVGFHAVLECRHSMFKARYFP